MALLISLVFGWWGFPWGLIFTPVQIARNISSILNPPDSAMPSSALREVVRENWTQITSPPQNPTGNAPPIPAP